MGGDRLKSKLERLHGLPDAGGGNAEARDALEQDLLLRYRKIHTKRRRWLSMLNPQTRMARFAFLGLAVLMLGVAACSTETTTEVEVGQQVSINLDSAGDRFAKSADMDAQIQAMVDALAAAPGVEGVNVNIEVAEPGGTTLNIQLFGDALDGDALAAQIRNDFPELADADIVVEALEGSVTETWAQRFGREFLNIEVDGSTPEEIRAQVLQNLADQGFEGDAEVIVEDEGDQRKIEIKLTEEEVVEE